MMGVKNKLSWANLHELHARRKQFIQSAVVLLWIVILVGCNAASKEESGYEIINTGIKLEGVSGYSWCDNNHIALYWQRDGKEGQSEIIYFEIHNPGRAQYIDLKVAQTTISDVHQLTCHNNEIIFVSYPSIVSDPMKRDPAAYVYSVRPGQAVQLIATMKRGGPYVNGKAKYIVGNNFAFWNEGEIDTQCATYIRTDYKLLCWTTWNRMVWPLSKYVLTEYRWEETVQVRGEDGKFKTIKNREKPFFDKQDKPISFALILYDLENRPLINLSEDEELGIPVQGHSLKAISPSEEFLYSVCRRKDYKVGSGGNSVCMFHINGRKNNWEHLFSLAQEKTEHIGIQNLSVSQAGEVFFVVPGNKRYRGIWKYTAAANKISQITNPPAYYDDTFPHVSVDGRWVAFKRPGQGSSRLFIVQTEVKGEAK